MSRYITLANGPHAYQCGPNQGPGSSVTGDRAEHRFKKVKEKAIKRAIIIPLEQSAN